VTAQLAGVDHLRSYLDTQTKYVFCGATHENPSGTARVRYSVAVEDTRMPLTSGDTGQTFVQAFVYPTAAEATACSHYFRSTGYTSFLSGKRVNPSSAKRVGQYTVEITPYKPNHAGDVPGRTGTFELDILNGHTVLLGESYSAHDAALIEQHAITVRDIIGN
jgi:hypothetical protein